MNIASLTSAKGTDFNDPAFYTRATGKSILDSSDFLKLLTVQLSSQDPLKPMEDTQFISQMASFTSLEQMKELTTTMKSFTAEQRVSSAQNYLGKMVSITTDAGNASGVVSAVTVENGEPRITIGGVSYDPADVTGISSPVPTLSQSSQ